MVDGQSNNIVAIIQARIGSSRLKGKVLKKLPYFSNLTILDQVVLRVKQSNYVKQVIIATSDSEKDDPIEKLCLQNEYSFFRGSENDVLNRFVRASYDLSKDDFIIRLTADNPFIDSTLIDLCIESHNKGNYDYSYTTNLPIGMNVEIVNKSVLDKLDLITSKISDKEHVTKYLRDNTEQFSINNIDYISSKCSLRLTIDYPSDYALACLLFKDLYEKNNFFGLNEIEQYEINHPWLNHLNNTNIQKSN